MIQGYHFSTDHIQDPVSPNRDSTTECLWNYVSQPRLGMVFLSIPARCNFRCLYCYTDSAYMASNETLSSFEVEDIIATSAQLGATSVVVAGNGEPFMSSAIWTIMDIANSRQMACVVFTNGSLITMDIAKQLYSKDISIIMKLHSLKVEVHDKLVGIKGAYNLTYSGLESLLEAGFKAPRLAIESPIMRTNIDDLKDVFIFCRMHDIVPYIETYVALGRGARREIRRELEPAPQQIADFFTDIRKLDKERFGIDWPITNKMRVTGYLPCNKNRVAITVKCNGDVYRCITESRKLGNIRKTSLREILASQNTLDALLESECFGCPSLRIRCEQDGTCRVNSWRD